jgi:hypothetical protein
MKTKRIPTWVRGGVCRVLLAVSALALVAPSAEAVEGMHLGYHVKDWFAVLDGASAEVNRGWSAVARIQQHFGTIVDGKARMPFHFVATVKHYGGVASASLYLLLKGEETRPPYFRDAKLTFRKQLGFSYGAGNTAVAVGNSTYDVRLNGFYALDFDLAGHALSVADTELSGQVRARAWLRFAVSLPAGLTIEEGTGPSFDSLLSCDLSTNNPRLLGNWCRLQQAPFRLKANLLKTVRRGRWIGTQVIPILDYEAPAVDKHLIAPDLRLDEGVMVSP